VEVDDIFGYDKLVAAEKATLQKGMNYRVRKDYSVFLMSLRENAPYADALDEVTGMLTYEGQDEPDRKGGPKPKEVDQPLTTPKGSWIENGKFFRAAAMRRAHACRIRQPLLSEPMAPRSFSQQSHLPRFQVPESRRFLSEDISICSCFVGAHTREQSYTADPSRQ